MSTPDAGNGNQQKSQTDLEMEAGQKANARYYRSTPPLPPKANGSGTNNPSTTGEANRQKQALTEFVRTPRTSKVRACHRQLPSCD
jgi:hypothetical protein